MALDAASRALAVESVASVVEVNYPWPDTARTAGAGRNVVQFPAELGLRVSLSTTRVYDPSSGREWERVGVLPDIVTTSEVALTTALQHARELLRVTPGRL